MRRASGRCRLRCFHRRPCCRSRSTDGTRGGISVYVVDGREDKATGTSWARTISPRICFKNWLCYMLRCMMWRTCCCVRGRDVWRRSEEGCEHSVHRDIVPVGHMLRICIKVGREAGIDKGNSKRAARTTDWRRYLWLWPNPFSSKALLQSCA